MQRCWTPKGKKVVYTDRKGNGLHPKETTYSPSNFEIQTNQDSFCKIQIKAQAAMEEREHLHQDRKD